MISVYANQLALIIVSMLHDGPLNADFFDDKRQLSYIYRTRCIF